MATKTIALALMGTIIAGSAFAKQPVFNPAPASAPFYAAHSSAFGASIYATPARPFYAVHENAFAFSPYAKMPIFKAAPVQTRRH